MDIATTLLEYGAKANAESKAGFTPLHLSAQEGHTDMSTLLIEHKADTNHKAKVGKKENTTHGFQTLLLLLKICLIYLFLYRMALLLCIYAHKKIK